MHDVLKYDVAIWCINLDMYIVTQYAHIVLILLCRNRNGIGNANVRKGDSHFVCKVLTHNLVTYYGTTFLLTELIFYSSRFTFLT